MDAVGKNRVLVPRHAIISPVARSVRHASECSAVGHAWPASLHTLS